MRTPQFTLTQRVLGKLVSYIVRLIKCTLNWKDEGLYNQDNVHWSEGKPVILVFWHSQQIFMPWVVWPFGCCVDAQSLKVIAPKKLLLRISSKNL